MLKEDSGQHTFFLSVKRSEELDVLLSLIHGLVHCPLLSVQNI